MKLLINPVLSQISEALSGDHGDTHVAFRIESYSCKMITREKKMFKQLFANGADVESKETLSPPIDSDTIVGSPIFHSLMTELSPSAFPDSVGTSTSDRLQYTCSTRTLYYLKATLNTAFAPDYDFSSATSEEFTKEPSLDWIQKTMNGHLVTVIENVYSMLPLLWQTLEKEIVPSECDIYSYRPDMDGDPFGEEGSLWSFNYFLYNKKLKRIVFIRANASSIHTGSEDDEMSENDMDMDDMHLPDESDESFSELTYQKQAQTNFLDLSYMGQ
eukprot:m.260323 g.260323  ORF g.260323 m.260323 type:complete len:273 (-) comp39669_c0_seq1:96-914(-)